MTRARIFYARVDEFWRKEEKYAYLDDLQDGGQIEWQELKPDAAHNWLTEGMQDEFGTFIPIGTKKAKAGGQATAEAIFKTFGGGVKTNRDVWVYNFSADTLEGNIRRTIELYNDQVVRWSRSTLKGVNIDDFLVYDTSKITWSETLKNRLESGTSAEVSADKIRASIFRPFTRSNLFFDRILNERVYIFPSVLPNRKAESENCVICVSDKGFRSPFSALATNILPDIHLCASSDVFQCFPFYTYNEDGTNRRENITDWSLEQFRRHYTDKSITKWDIFHYVYALLHHPVYRERYAANLKRQLPRIPYAPDFKGFAKVGKRLAEIHISYEQQLEYSLEKIETPDALLDWRVEKMKLSKDKRSIIYNEFLTLGGIPPEVFEYRLGNRSALEWIIDQYQVSTDKRSGITNDPNRPDDPEYVVRLVGQVITVSLETVELVNSLAALELVSAG